MVSDQRQVSGYDVDMTAQSTAKVRVLIAIEPRSYREVIGEAIQSLRPQLKVLIVEPDDLAEEVARLDPELIICGQPEDTIPKSKSVWVEYRPYAEPAARISMNGRYRELSEVELEDLLSVADEVEKLNSASRNR